MIKKFGQLVGVTRPSQPQPSFLIYTFSSTHLPQVINTITPRTKQISTNHLWFWSIIFSRNEFKLLTKKKKMKRNVITESLKSFFAIIMMSQKNDLTWPVKKTFPKVYFPSYLINLFIHSFSVKKSIFDNWIKTILFLLSFKHFLTKKRNNCHYKSSEI